ncbi:OmpA family protein [Alcanivorax sp. VBW004]|uniref:OmpA family protein n=1 Tax=Alcanivorax sp. VBW004 TaxID=1287708 RepID=UPI0012BD2F19|nr:OmpA family protein [Alcanivorax sp. VBW004]MTT54075.1 OmpA family protein [Alcanivorax sp. VBW004]
MKKCNALAVAASCGFLFLGGCAGKVPDDAWPGYRTDGKGQLLKTADGHCWRTADWSEDKAVPECDVAITGEPVAEQEEKPSTTEVASPEIVVPKPLRVTFAFDSAVLTDASRIALKAWYQNVANLEEPVVEVNGYSDPLGRAVYNQSLADLRAQAVATWWKNQGDSIATLQVKGHGEDTAVSGSRCQSVSAGELKACYRQDRRVELQVQ